MSRPATPDSNTPISSGVSASNDISRPDSPDYSEQVSSLSRMSPHDIDFKTVNKHLVSPDDTLKMQGGDVARYLQHQIASSGGPAEQRRRARSSSFSDFAADARRESMASDINVPGGFRREFLINRSLQQRQTPPSFLTRNFVEFLSIYGHFAGEDFSDDDSDGDTDSEVGGDGDNDDYADTFDEESALLASERQRGPPTPNVPPRRPKHKHAQKKGTATATKTFFLLFKALVGSGVLFLPRAFCNGGLVFSTATLGAFGVITFVCYMLLITSKRVFSKSSFGELGFVSYGNPLKYAIMVSILISQIGFVATYILFTAENITSFLAAWLNLAVRKSTVVVAQCVLLIPLVLIRDLTKLSFTSLVSSSFIVVGLVIIFYFCTDKLLSEGPGPNMVNFNGSTWSLLFGVAVTSFEGIGLILPIEASMARPDLFPHVLALSMAVITTLFIAVGIIGYTAFGDHVRSIIILNLPQGNAAVQLIMVLYSAAVFLSAPLQLFPAIKIGESVLFNSWLFAPQDHRSHSDQGRLYHTSGKYNPHIKWMKNLFRALAVVVISVISYLNADNIDKFVSFNGCFACIPLVYIYPTMIHLKTLPHDGSVRTTLVRVFDWCLIAVGTVVMVYTTRQILFLI